MSVSQLTAWFQSLYRTDAWIYQVFLVVLFTVFANALVRYLLKRLAAQLARTATYWDDALIDAARRPLAWLVWVVGLSVAAELVAPDARSELFDFVDPARRLAIIGLVVWFLVRFINNVAHALVQPREGHTPVDVTTATAISRLLRISVIITATLVAAQSLGFSISGVLAFGGVGGIAVGFAAKDLLANFFGGLMIYLDRPFVVGEWIRSPDRNIEGTVEHIGWRLTTIRTFDRRPLYVPNSAFATISVENPSRMSNRRIFETLGLRIEDADRLPAIVAEVRAMLQAHPELDATQTLIVNFNGVGPSSLDFFVYTFTRTTVWVEYHAVKERVLFQVLEIIARHGAQLARPTTRLLRDDEVGSGGRAEGNPKS
ncbi:mechanosensitive ion channel protein MscS [Chitiniphilus shinanonensis]|uniref:Mechanosensitive ion channel protein MscS n=1 Tax=Chitiniphilus shinanonensis TaxID=553088 RepID=A0ABQ6BU62_9NEIS|nr:mechanosensitive ion channel family protein [Chitiniphilus shinanonensis]GLS03339.1 mechanosensitive ion channel protein MscS [Chitiniphilus shinanonensis]